VGKSMYLRYEQDDGLLYETAGEAQFADQSEGAF
jgi:hypothetical protein